MVEERTIKQYLATHIYVQREMNDDTDRRAGGSAILGYDFFVNPKSAKNLVSFIKTEIRAHEQPLEQVGIGGQRWVPKLWTKRMIRAEIERGY